MDIKDKDAVLEQLYQRRTKLVNDYATSLYPQCYGSFFRPSSRTTDFRKEIANVQEQIHRLR